MRGRLLTHVISCACLIVAAGCSEIDIDVSRSDGSTAASTAGSAPPEPPATTLPLTQTPEYVASNTPCPAGLPELGAIPLGEAAPGESIFLMPFIDLAEATVMVFDPDRSDRGFVGDRRGRIWRFTLSDSVDGSAGDVATLSDQPVADFSSDTAAEHDQGLVGMTLGPDGRVWINRTDRRGASVLTVLTPTDDRTALHGDYTDVLTVKQTNAQHNGGDLVFDPDGLLYVSFGDGGGLGDPRNHGQNLATPLGAVLRFALDTRGSDVTADWQLVPAAGNPDLGPGSDASIWAYGARNPFRMSIDDKTGTLWIADVGQQCIEEITALGLDEGGANLGWNSFEGSRRFVGPDLSDHRPPDFEYRHGRGLCAVIGGHIYRGGELGWLSGRYVFADLCGGDVYAAAVAPGAQTDEVTHLGVSTPRPVGFAVDAAGEMYVIDMETGVWRLTG